MNVLVAFVLWFIATAAAAALVLLRIYGHEPCSAQPEKFSTRWRRPKPPANAPGSALKSHSHPTAAPIAGFGT
jgi:hypothetical protein